MTSQMSIVHVMWATLYCDCKRSYHTPLHHTLRQLQPSMLKCVNTTLHYNHWYVYINLYDSTSILHYARMRSDHWHYTIRRQYPHYTIETYMCSFHERNMYEILLQYFTDNIYDIVWNPLCVSTIIRYYTSIRRSQLYTNTPVRSYVCNSQCSNTLILHIIISIETFTSTYTPVQPYSTTPALGRFFNIILSGVNTPILY